MVSLAKASTTQRLTTRRRQVHLFLVFRIGSRVQFQYLQLRNHTMSTQTQIPSSQSQPHVACKRSQSTRPRQEIPTR